MNLKTLLFIPPVLVGIGAMYLLGAGKGDIGEVTPPVPVAVRVLEVAPQSLAATAVGFGRVEAAQSWAAIAEIEGKITHMAPELTIGGRVEQGQLLIGIDPVAYELNVEKAHANLASAEADLRELGLQEDNTRSSLEIEQRNLEINQEEYDRVERLVTSGASSQSNLDAQAKTLQSALSSVQSKENTLSLYPVQRQTQEATIRVRQSELTDAQTDLANTNITSPFTGRVTEVSAELARFGRVGDNLAQIDAIATAEIVAELPPSTLRPLVTLQGRMPTQIDSFKVVDALKSMGITASVHSTAPGDDASWPAELLRSEGTVDAETGNLSIVVSVAHPFESPANGGPYPLAAGSFVEVRLTSREADGVIAVPRNAVLHGADGAAFVYLANDSDQLTRTAVSISAVIDDLVVLADGVSPGDRVVLSRPQPAVEGMFVTPIVAQGN